MKIISLNCPKCGASLSTEDNRMFFFCHNCGNKVMLQNENEYIIRHVDDAEVLQAETEQIVQLKQLEIQEKQRTQLEEQRKKRTKVAKYMLPIGIIMVITGFTFRWKEESLLTPLSIIALFGIFAILISLYLLATNLEEDQRATAQLNGLVQVPDVFDNLKSKSYQEVETAFKNAGFTNVKCLPRKDLTLGLVSKSGSVAVVTINGKETIIGNEWCQPSVPVVITYHKHMWSKS